MTDTTAPKGPDAHALRAFGDNVAFGRTATDYATHRAGFPQAFFDLAATRGFATAPAHALDIGTGTGTLARGLARIGLEVTGLDPSEELMAQATRLDAEEGVKVTYIKGAAESLPVGNAQFDLVTAGQCWHWFDRPRAAAEAARVLRPGGRCLIAHFDWLPLPGNVVAATEALILAYNPAWAGAHGTGLYPDWLTDLATAGFTDIETASFDIFQPYSHDAWRGRIRASAGVAASLPEAEVAAFDSDLADLLDKDFPEAPLQVPHRVWLATGVKKAA
ncbi:class I SAM-dependent methyltransferase [Roseovarius indicus]|uniref:class I SAM-dependent methyltransferase n=1 Tax=Roseovarius indicus TaxID=540747 RepID=UPI0032ED5905